MKVFKNMSFLAGFFVLFGQLNANSGVMQLNAESQLYNKGHHSDCDSHRHSSSHWHHNHDEVKTPAFLYALTPEAYQGQPVGTGQPNDTVAVLFPLLGDVSAKPPAIQITPSLFRVQRSGHYLINWGITVDNGDTATAFFSSAISVNGIVQGPTRHTLTLLSGADTEATGSIILPLSRGDLVQLNVINFNTLITPLNIIAADINFVRIAPLP